MLCYHGATFVCWQWHVALQCYCSWYWTTVLKRRLSCASVWQHIHLHVCWKLAVISRSRVWFVMLFSVLLNNTAQYKTHLFIMLIAVCIIKTEGNICRFLKMLKTLSFDNHATSKMVVQMCYIFILHVHCLSCWTVVTILLHCCCSWRRMVAECEDPFVLYSDVHT